MNLSKIVVMTTIFLIFGLFSVNFATPVAALSLVLTVPSEPLTLEIQPISTFTKSSPSSISVKTDAPAGYSLSIKSQDGNELKNGINKLPSITQNLSEEQYQEEGNLNTWGYKPSKINGLENTLFLPGPSEELSLIETTNMANNIEETSYEFVLASKVDATIDPGTYKNTFVFSATANTVPYSIEYELNSGSWSGESPQIGNTTDNTVTLDPNKPIRDWYDFIGWCPQETSNETCGTASYQPGSPYPLNGDNNTVKLWAMWRRPSRNFEQAYEYAGKQKQGGYYTMQDMSTAAICQNVTTGVGTSITLIDTRDSKTYTVAKLADGKCWLTQDLGGNGTTWTNCFYDNKCPTGWNSDGGKLAKLVEIMGNVHNPPANFANATYYNWALAGGCRSYSYLSSDGHSIIRDDNNNSLTARHRIRCVHD